LQVSAAAADKQVNQRQVAG